MKPKESPRRGRGPHPEFHLGEASVSCCGAVLGRLRVAKKRAGECSSREKDHGRKKISIKGGGTGGAAPRNS